MYFTVGNSPDGTSIKKCKQIVYYVPNCIHVTLAEQSYWLLSVDHTLFYLHMYCSGTRTNFDMLFHMINLFCQQNNFLIDSCHFYQCKISTVSSTPKI